MRNKKVGLARRVRTRLARFPFCDGRVTILAGPSFLRINTLARILDPSAPHGVEITPSRVNLVTWLKVRQSEHAHVLFYTIKAGASAVGSGN